ncbi:MAG: glycerol-3-phosphate 1-O-acyltransferase PlsY [Xanthobacteraceae bacterium]
MFSLTDWMLGLPPYAVALAFGYLLGSIPFGLVLTRLAGTADIRSIGSGNIGATNVLRTGRKSLAAATLAGDMLKGTVAVLTMNWLWGPEHAMLAGLGAFLGHLFPVWLRFKGGKGVATYIGILLGLAWPAVLAFGLIWIIVAAIFRYSSLAGLLAATLMPVFLWFIGDKPQAIFILLLTLVLWITHRANIRRLLAGTEPHIGKSSGSASPA